MTSNAWMVIDNHHLQILYLTAVKLDCVFGSDAVEETQIVFFGEV